MTPVLVVIAVIVAAGGVAAVGSANPRVAALGMTVALAGSAFVADPLPGAVGVAACLTGSLLAGYLVWIAVRGAPPEVHGTAGSLPAAAAVAVVAFVAGWLAAGSLGAAMVAGPGDGPGLGTTGVALAAGSPVARAALASALALGAMAAAPVVMARDTLRLGLGLMLLLAAAALVRNALTGATGDVVQVGGAVLTAIAGAAVAAVIASSLRRTGDVELHEGLRRDATIRHRPADDAHRPHDGPAR
jgi:hypothetical protein